MSHLTDRPGKLPSNTGKFLALLTLITFLVSCTARQDTKVAHKTFASPAEASAAIFEAAKSGDQNALLAIFGPESKDILFSGDAVKDKDAIQDLVAAYGQMNRWVKLKMGGQMLYIGADNFPFPIPLRQNSNGQWYFDTSAGEDEILARRIGKGELIAIDACNAVADAQEEYFARTHRGDKVRQFAQKFVSDQDKQDGLYWPAAEGQAPSPLGQLGDFAKAVGYTNAGDKPQPFNGYYFRLLSKQGDMAPGGARNFIVDGKMTGGFAVLAYPSDYGNSGIMTFVIGKDGIVYQKDLGEKTAQLASSIEEYNPGDGWNSAL